MGREAIPSAAESVEAAWSLAWNDTLVGMGARHAAISELESTGATPLSPEEANKLYPGLAEPFRDPVNPYVAKLKYDQQVEKQELQRKIQEGPQDAWTRTKTFGAGLMAHLMDPLEFGAGAMVGWGVGGLAARGAFGVRAAEAAQASRAGMGTLAQNLAYDGIEAGGGAFIENIAQEALQKATEYREGITDDRTNQEIATDILFGTVASFGLQSLPKSLPRGVRYSMDGVKRFMRGTSPEADLPIARNIIHASPKGLLPDSTRLQKAIAQETNVPHEAVGYEYTPLSRDYFSAQGNELLSMQFKKDIFSMNEGSGTLALSPAEYRQVTSQKIRSAWRNGEISERMKNILITKLDDRFTEVMKSKRASFFEGVNDVEGFLKTISPEEVDVSISPESRRKKFYTASPSHDPTVTTALGNDYGFGTHVTDNPGVANAAAVRGLSDGAGTVREVDFDALNPLDLNSPLPVDLAGKLSKYLDENELGELAEGIDAMPARNMLEYVRNAVDSGFLDEDAFTKVKGFIQDSGFDSMISDGKNFNGADHLPHNHLTILDEGKIRQKAEYSPNTEVRGDLTEQELRDAEAEAEQPRRIFQYDDYDKKVQQMEEELEVLATTDARKQLETDLEELQLLEQQGLVSKTDIEAIKEAVAEADDSHTLLKHFAACVRRTE